MTIAITVFGALTMSGFGSTAALGAVDTPAWVLVAPDSQPQHSAPVPITAFDAATGQVVRVDLYGSTWTWDGARWSTRELSTWPTHYLWPSSLTYDSATRQLVMFTGTASALPAVTVGNPQTWTWTGAAWNLQHPALEPPLLAPACSAFDVSSGQLIMFGTVGQGVTGSAGESWDWTGSTWIQLHPARTPPLGACSMAYDPTAGGLVLTTVGPSANGGGTLGTPQVWIWDGTDWTQLPSPLPPMSSTPSLVYDPERGALLARMRVCGIDGGVNNFIWCGYENETWSWTQSQWSMLDVTTPFTRGPQDGVMVYDDATRQLMYDEDESTFLDQRDAVPSFVTPSRVSGSDRISTAVAVSQAAFPAAQSASVVVLTRADAFADALTGGPLAATKKGPLLLTSSGSLDVVTAAEVKRVLKPGGTVYLLGGTSALSPSVATAVAAMGDVSVRLSGTDRFGTALSVAGAMGNPSTVFEADGGGFADALSAGPAAAAMNGVVLLTSGSVETSATAAYLKAHPGVHYAVGGPAATADPTAIALAGADRYATSEAVALAIFPAAAGTSFASGASFPDALAGAPAAGSAGEPLLLVPSTGPLPEPIGAYLGTRHGTATHARIFGGSRAVGDDVLAEVGAAFSG